MRATTFVAAVLTGCLAAPPAPSGDDPADGDDRGGADAATGAVGGCVPGSRLDLAWVNQVAFDQEAASQVTLSGLAVVVNPGPDPIELASMFVLPANEGEVAGGFYLTGGDLTLAPGQAMGAVSTGAAGVLAAEFDEEWANFAAPELGAVIRFDETTVDADLPVRLQIGGYTFEVAVHLAHDPTAVAFDWARAADRTTVFCE